MSVFSILQIILLLISIGVSGLVLWGQRRVAIRESIEQIDDRSMAEANTKVKPILHSANLRNCQTTIDFRYSKMGNYAGISNLGNIREVSDNIAQDALGVDGVESTLYWDSTEKKEIGSDDPIEEGHVVLRATCDTIDPEKCRYITDRVLSRIRLADRQT